MTPSERGRSRRSCSIQKVLSAILCSIHNVHFYQHLMREAREAIQQDAYDDFRSEFLARYQQAS